MMFLGLCGIVLESLPLFVAESRYGPRRSWSTASRCLSAALVLGIGLLWELVLHFFVPVNVGIYITEEPARNRPPPKRRRKKAE